MKMKKSKTYARNFKLSLTNIYRVIDGKKYNYQGTVPKAMEYDIKRIYEKHGMVIKVEPISVGKVKLWGRSK